jgi:hypothetical protein
MQVRKNITKISKKKSKVTEIVTFKDFQQMPSERKMLNNQDDYIMFSGHYKEFVINKIVIQLTEICKDLPEVYVNGLKLIVGEKDVYKGPCDLLFDGSSIGFSPESLNDGDIIQIVYMTKNKKL